MPLAPIKPSQRTEGIRYAVRDIVVLAQEAAKTGMPMLYLNIGDPNVFDFTVPTTVVEAAHRAFLANKCSYSPSSGIGEAIEAIRGEAARKGIKNVLDVFVTTGASEAIELCLTALLNPGDNVLTPAPGYPLYTAVEAKLGAATNPYYLDEANGWRPDVDDIERKINARTRGIVLINPNNPTGALYSEASLRKIIELAKAHNLVIFADEIYDKLLMEGKRHVSIAGLDPEVSCITFNGLSKSYLGPGLRIGWGIVSGQREILKDFVEAVNKMLRARLCANHPLQYAIKPCLQGDQGHLPEVIAKLTRRRNITFEMLNAIDGISCVSPEGAFYAFPKLEGVKDDAHWVAGLVKSTGVVVVHGSGFGQRPGTAHFRVVFLPPEDTLRQAYEKIAAYHRQYRNP
ncbi:MAG: aminotransferase class I/II-fold pyridoxal phosphate-dependent enzyme [Myxococcales bacterium]|nr:MAG: aminotransferase class I/II-fold pyridoxal phosphate-dependent enzyme [Myxococcales bacterium]